MKLQVPRDLSKGCLMQAVAFILASLSVIVLDSKPAHASCQNIQGNYGSSYYVCSFGISVMLQGSNSRTGSNWTENCFGVGTSFTSCYGNDAMGNFWSCTYSQFLNDCYKSEILN